jgi:acetyl-CoA carboxylase alpha subunit
MRDYLEFEKPLREIEEKIEKLAAAGSAKTSVQEELRKLKARLAQEEVELYSKLTPWQRTQLARHAQRPSVLDMSTSSAVTFKNCTATAPLRMTGPLSADLPGSMNNRS